MRAKLFRLSKHLDSLQAQALSQNGSNAMYEPPLINVFTMQWFLTLFSTCLPEETVLRVWDSILLEGSEVLLRAAVAIWGKLGEYVSSTALFYLLYGHLDAGGGGGWGAQKILIRGATAPRSNPLPFYIQFPRKRYPYLIPSIDKWYPFHIPLLELCIPFKCCKCAVFHIGINRKNGTFSRLYKAIKFIC